LAARWQRGLDHAGVNYYATPPRQTTTFERYFTSPLLAPGRNAFCLALSPGLFYLTVDGVFQTNLQVTAGSVQTFTVANLPFGTHTIRGITWKATTDPSQPGVTYFSVTRPDM